MAICQPDRLVLSLSLSLPQAAGKLAIRDKTTRWYHVAMNRAVSHRHVTDQWRRPRDDLLVPAQLAFLNSSIRRGLEVGLDMS